jgi:hypothetical protein
LVAAIAPPVGFAVLTTPIVSIERAICDLPFCEPVRRGLAGRSLDLGRFNLTTRKPVVATKDLLLMESRHDLFAPAETVEQLWHAWGEPEIWRLAHGHISVLLSWNVLRQTVRWIAARVGTGG